MYIPEPRFRLGTHGATPLDARWELIRQRLVRELPLGHPSRGLLTAACTEETIDRMEFALLDYVEERRQDAIAARNARPQELVAAEQEIKDLQRRYHDGVMRHKQLDNKLRPAENSVESKLLGFIPPPTAFPVLDQTVSRYCASMEEAEEMLEALEWNVSIVEEQVSKLAAADRFRNLPLAERAWLMIEELVQRLLKLEALQHKETLQ